MSDSQRSDFVCTGTQKSGATWLYENLAKHQEVFMSEVKEPGCFVSCVNYCPKDYEWYRSLFKDVKNEKIIGDQVLIIRDC